MTRKRRGTLLLIVGTIFMVAGLILAVYGFISGSTAPSVPQGDAPGTTETGAPALQEDNAQTAPEEDEEGDVSGGSAGHGTVWIIFGAALFVMGAAMIVAGGRNKPKGKAAKTVLFTFLSILATAAVFVIVFFIWIYSVPAPDLGPLPSSPAVSDTPTQEPGGTAKPPDNGGALAWNEDVRTVLLTGSYNSVLTDTIMVAAINYKAHTMNVLSVPRDTVISYGGKRTKINEIYGKKDSGSEGLAEALQAVLGFKPGSTVHIKSDAFKRAVDAVGGVPFDVPMNLSKPSEGINLRKGQQVLNGEKALMLMRFRTYGGNNPAGIPHDDFGRIHMQQQFLRAAANQIISLQGAMKVGEFVDIFNKNVTTSLSLDNLAWYAREILKVDPDSINFYTLPTESVDKSYEYILTDKALEMINKSVNPYNTDITKEMINHTYSK
jgi:LCP family protein required for cell wall assembly